MHRALQKSVTDCPELESTNKSMSKMFSKLFFNFSLVKPKTAIWFHFKKWNSLATGQYIILKLATHLTY